MIHIIFLIIISLIVVLSIYAAVQSAFEKEKRAARIFSFLGSISLGITVLGFAEMIPLFAESAFVMLSAGVSLLLFFPWAGTKHITTSTPAGRIDERLTMFSRAKLEKGSKHYSAFYTDYPELELTDDQWRKNPGLGSKGSRFYSPLYTAAAEASFLTIGKNRAFRTFHAEKDPHFADTKTTGTYIHRWLKLLGAHDSGICNIHPYHRYSKKGYGEEYGKEPQEAHQYAVAFIVPMDKHMVDTAPHPPTMTESAHQYANSGIIAIQLAAYISRLGYDATAHIDGTYDMVLPLVAADAGLGTIGRMGVLMHPLFGPRCRIAVVSTNMPLPLTQKYTDKSLLDFCRLCKKCAVVCPSASIPKGDRETIDNTFRWKINQEACYTYWTVAGTDCARCMSVCPYSHENNLIHRFIRFGIRHNKIFRYLAVKLDDVFYGKKPGSKSCHHFEY
ncbi:MAG: 4Fe-4S dicluster domain-containing protein [Bacteroidota bacterium]